MKNSMERDIQNDQCENNDRYKENKKDSYNENSSSSSQSNINENETTKEEENKKELTQWDGEPLLKKRNIKLFEENELNGIVNALPYIDAFDKEHEELAKQLIEEEMKLMKEKNEIKNYLKNIDIPYTKCLSSPDSLLYKELKRCEENIKFPKLSFDHYNLEKEEEEEEEKEKEENEVDTGYPKYKDLCIEEWKEKIKKYETILENSHNALVNIELMDKYKSVSWEEHVNMFNRIDINLQNNISSLKQEIEDINKKRKLHQLSFVNDLTSLQQERKEYKRKSNMVLMEINRLFAENRLLEYKQNLV